MALHDLMSTMHHASDEMTIERNFTHMVAHLFEGRCFAIASFALVFFDYVITVDDEIRYFWSGNWTISRILFLCNRYFSIAVLVFRIIADFFAGSFPPDFCDIALRINFPLNLLALAVVQGILVIRLWYLFTSSKVAQHLLLATYILCTIGSFTCLALMFPVLHTSVFNIPNTSHWFCRDPPPAPFWMVFIPSFVLHAVLSGYMIARIVRNVWKGDKSVSLRKRLTRDGGFLYMVIFFSVSFSVCSAIFGASPSIGVVAMFANFMLALLSITVSRVIFHIVRLANSYSTNPCSKDPILLLHTAPVSSDASSSIIERPYSGLWRIRNLANGLPEMGVLFFVPPEDYHYDEDEMWDGEDGWRRMDEKSSILDEVYY